MIVYFADRQLNIIGQASTELPEGLTVIEDLKTEDVETGVAIFECKIPFSKENRADVENFAAVGNYILRSHDSENEFYTIIEVETDTKNQEVYIYAEDAGMDLLNEVFGDFAATSAQPISYYIQKFAYDSGFVIGINEASKLTRKLSWEGEATAAERIASAATQFDGCEVSYSFDIDGLTIKNKYINIYKQRGKDIGVTLRLNNDIDSIVTTKSVANLATALYCTGGTPDDAEKPITLNGYKYDDGNYYVSGNYLKSREALKKWSRYNWGNEPNKENDVGHIVKAYSYDTTSQSELCAHALTELKKVSEIEVNYEVDIRKLPDNVKIGDRVNIVDDAGELYLSTRILQLEASVADQTYSATLGEHLLKKSGISQKVIDLAEQFAKTSLSAARALMLANNANTAAGEAKEQAQDALAGAEEAQSKADAATEAANTATQSAADATEAANNAQSAVDAVEKSVESLETTVENAQTAADNAQQAAAEAQAKADEAAQNASNAVTEAANAKTAADNATEKAETAISNATAAQDTATEAKTTAESATATAQAAKLDAEQAVKDVAALGDELETVSNTMQADYARKTDLTEATASLQTQITQNAAEISSTATKVQEIDETANNAQEQAGAAQAEAEAAKAQADQATADAAKAQTAADNAAAAATNAQTEADNAKAAAQTAQGVADKAKADLEAAEKDLATVTGRVDATEEEIAAAQAAVTAAQAAADKAQEDADTAAQKAADAQSTANTAVTDAAAAQTKANEAASNAALAQQAADQAKGDAAAAQQTANEAAATAAEAQRIANTATTNAANAQAAADQAAQDAEAAQKAADDADAKAAQAATDLATAKQNLADVTSRVGATEEEVEAAKTAVATAQKAAEDAQSEAGAAQATADTAKANAATAQTAADNAKAAADKAQEDAEAAQKAAGEAQAAVDALAVRVTTAETKITQNSEQIALMATKEEVTQTLGGYYTKEEADAAIKVSADAVETTVKNTYATKDALNGEAETYSGNPLTLKIGENRIQSVAIHGKTTQTGSGTASPDNVRNISGVGMLDAVLVLTGTENFELEATDKFAAGRYVAWSTASACDASVASFCSHYGYSSNSSVDKTARVTKSGGVYVVDTDYATVADFKAYLAEQYAAGTPVTVWYKKATHTEGDPYYTGLSVEDANGYTGHGLPLAHPLYNSDTLETNVESEYDKKVVLDGSEDETYTRVSVTGVLANNGFARWRLDLLTDVTPSAGNSAIGQIVTSAFPTVTANNTYYGTNGIAVTANGSVWLFIKGVYEYPDLCAYLAANPLTIWYKSVDGGKNLRVCKETHTRKRLVLDGTEVWYNYRETENTETYFGFQMQGNSIPKADAAYTAQACSHLNFGAATASGYYPNTFRVHSVNGTMYVRVEIDGVTSADTWKTYLAEQYAAGTPVTVMYSLNTPEVYARDVSEIPNEAGNVTLAAENTMDVTLWPVASQKEVQDETERATEAEESILETVSEKETAIIQTSEEITLTALENYVKSSEYSEFKTSTETQLSVLSDEITMNFDSTTEQIKKVDDEVQSNFSDLNKHISFSGNGITISAGDNEMSINIDNDGVSFKKNGVQFGWWDGIDFYTGNITIDVTERAQFGNFAYVPRSDGSLSFLKVEHKTGFYAVMRGGMMIIYGAYPTLSETTLVITDITGTLDGTTLLLTEG